jgi:HPr kinase/phosphorylase
VSVNTGFVTVEELLRSKTDAFSLELLNAGADVQRRIEGPSLSSPGLILAGYTERFPAGRVQIFGETEVRYLRAMAKEDRRAVIERFLTLDIPMVAVTKGQAVPPDIVEMAERARIPLIRSTLKTGDFYRRLYSYLEERLAPTTQMHGSLADVYGVGLLFVGKSGIGKSECVLDLVERGHRLVADDMVMVSKRGNEILLGRSSELQRHHMEIRGVGIIDIRALFGIRAIRQQKRIEVVVQLEEWDDRGTYDRTGLDLQETEILGVQLPIVRVPLNPGKNITVVSEVVAMNHLLKYSGVNSAAEFNDRLMKKMRNVRDYLEEDYE